MSESEVRERSASLAAATAAWVLLAGVVGYLVLQLGPACDLLWDDDYEPLGAGAEAVCGGEFPFTPTFLTFVAVTFTGVAVLILRWDAGDRPARGLCVGVALLPAVAFAVLRVVTLVP